MSTAVAHPNIALVKYWGKRDLALNLPAVSSLSLTLSRFHSTTTVRWAAEADRVLYRGAPAPDKFAAKVLRFLDRLDAARPPVEVETENSFPTGAGLASSASGFAALALAAAHAAKKPLDRTQLSVLARMGSGSACRSLWGGFVRWDRGERADGLDSHGVPVAGPDHWDLRMVVAVVSKAEKAVGSTEGMERSRASSGYYRAWVENAEPLVAAGEDAVRRRDLQALGEIMEASTFQMHAAMHTANPPLLYWQPATVACLHAVFGLRERGIPAWCTMDAGPNVKVLTTPDHAEAVAAALRAYVDDAVVLSPGPDAQVRG